MAAVGAFETFDADDDPHGERDFGALAIRGERPFWKIDYYDLGLEYGLADPAITRRVLTLMLAEEY